MHVAVLALLIPLVVACTSGERSPRASTGAPTGGVTVSVEEQAAERACSVYGQAPVWDAREIDTNGDGANDFTEVHPATGSDKRVSQIADSAVAARQDPRFRPLAAAVDFLVSVHERGGDRSEVVDAEVRMTEACDSLAP